MRRPKNDGEQLISNHNVKNNYVGWDRWHSIKQEGLIERSDGIYLPPDSPEAKEHLTRKAAEDQERAERLNQKADQETLAAYVAGTDALYLAFRRDNDQYAFACLENGLVVAVNQLVVPGRIIRPRPLPVVEGSPLGIVALPGEGILTAPLLPPERLFAAIRDHIDRYVDLPDLDLELATYYVLFTWIYPKVDTVPYLRIISDTGKGKTRTIVVIGDLCFYTLTASGASSFSGMARMQQKWRGTLKCDEGDFAGDKDSQMTKYFNLGFERGQYYILSDKQDPKRQDIFNPFCPKVIAMREPFNDNATEGRLLSISMHELTRPDIPIILPTQYHTETQNLRDQMGRFTLEHWQGIDGSRMLRFDDLNIEPRLKQLAMPLSIVFQLLPDGADRFRAYLTARQTEIKRIRAISWVGSLVNAAVAMGRGDLEPGDEFNDMYDATRTLQAITPSMMAKQFKSSTKTVTQTLASAGFKVERRWITKAGHDRKQVRAYVVPDQQTWTEIVRRYIEEDDTDMPPVLKSCVYVEVSQPSLLSQTPDPVTVKTDVTGQHTRTVDALEPSGKGERL